MQALKLRGLDLSYVDQNLKLDRWEIPHTGRMPEHSVWITFWSHCMAMAELLSDRNQDFCRQKQNRKLFTLIRNTLARAIATSTGNYTCFIPSLLWMQGRFWLATFPNTAHHNYWQGVLSKAGINLAMYTDRWCQNQFGVYLMLSPKDNHSYIGATECTLAGRYMSRVRKLRQLSNSRFVECEVALRFWHARKNFHNYIPLLVAETDSKLAALVIERQWQQQHQPSLVVPWIGKHFSSNKNFGAAKRVSSTQLSSKLYKRFRFKAQNEQGVSSSRTLAVEDEDQVAHSQKNVHQVHLLLHHLGDNNVNRFRASRQLRRKPVDKLQLYYLWRKARHMDEPYKSRATAELTRIFQKVNLKLPEPCRPFNVPWLEPTQSFRSSLKQFLLKCVHKWSEKWTPLHWPSVTLVEGKQQTIADVLHNWREEMKNWVKDPPKTCPCSQLLDLYPDLPCNQDRHIAGPFMSEFFPVHIKNMSDVCTKDGAYPSRNRFLQILLRSIQKWVPKYVDQEVKDDISRMAEQFLEEQWGPHHRELLNSMKFNIKTIRAIRQLFQGLIFHNEDHKQHRLCIYCPMRYHSLLLKTFQDSEVFTTADISSTLLRLTLPDQVPARIKRRYEWAANQPVRIATGYILPKGKKQYTNARPIVASEATYYHKLFIAVARVLRDITPVAYPHTFGHRKMNELLQALHEFLGNKERGSRNTEFYTSNDDLKGFFTSVPPEFILQAVQHAVHRYTEVQPSGKPLEQIVFSVPLKIVSASRLIRGRSFVRSTTNKIIWLEDVPTIAAMALQFGFFTCLGQVYQQSRGAIIGGHASPALCALAVTFKEQMWLQAYNVQITSSSLLCIRYVDNRFVAIKRSLMKQAAFQRFLSMNFYDPPVELEPCGNDDLVGYRLDFLRNQCLYVVPTESYEFRSSKSAGSTSRNLSGLNARLHLLYRGTFPRSLAPTLVSQLLEGYSKKGFDPAILRRMAFKVSLRYQGSDFR